jgi:hypothetical protein
MVASLAVKISKDALYPNPVTTKPCVVTADSRPTGAPGASRTLIGADHLR